MWNLSKVKNENAEKQFDGVKFSQAGKGCHAEKIDSVKFSQEKKVTRQNYNGPSRPSLPTV